MDDYAEWHKQKLLIQEKDRPYFIERDIWSCALGENIGVEQNGRGHGFQRPILVIRKFNTQSLWGLPLTHTRKDKSSFYYSFSFKEGELSTVNLSQIRNLDAKRLIRKIGEISNIDFSNIVEGLRALLP